MDLVSVLCNRPKAHLQELRTAYEAKYGDNLLKLMARENRGLIEEVFMGLLRTDAENRCFYFNEGAAGVGTAEDVLVDVLATADPTKMAVFRAEWKKEHPLIQLDSRVKLETKGDLQKIFEAFLNESRPASGIMEDKIEADLDILFKATEGKLGTDEKSIAQIVSERSPEHLKVLDEMFQKKSKRGRRFVETIKSEMRGVDELAFMAAFMTAHEWHAFRINMAVRGIGTDEALLCRAIMLAGEEEIAAAAATIQREHDYDLAKRIGRETSGELGEVLDAYVSFCMKQ